ncbi:MAG: hypothetical protein AB7K64_21335 [Variibacter sp.]
MAKNVAMSQVAMPQMHTAAQSSASATLIGLPVGVAFAVCGLLLLVGGKLLNDPDTLWQIVIGHWIIDHRAVPHVDTFSSTFNGARWISTQWLAQVALALVHEGGGWSAVVALTALAAALAFALLTRMLLARLSIVATLMLVIAAVMLAAPHLVARPHVLALPIMVAWMGALVRAADRAAVPPLPLVALMALWANLHGGFILGLALIAPLGLDAALNAERTQRFTVLVRWIIFGLAATATACATPYGVETILAAFRILGLGPAFSLIGEWKPQDFSAFSAFELCLLLAFGFVLLRGFSLPPLRILILLGLLHTALSHVRSAEAVALLAPLLVAAPLARHLGEEGSVGPSLRKQTVLFAIATLALAGTGFAFAATRHYAPDPQKSPVAAVAALKKATQGRVLNEYDFGGYLIASGIAPFIDGRTELYGAAFVVRHHRAVMLQDVPDFLALLDEYKIEATLFSPQLPAVGLMDRLPGWKRIYADDTAVVHVRIKPAQSDAAASSEQLGLRR